jgi:hypothetical protein
MSYRYIPSWDKYTYDANKNKISNMHHDSTNSNPAPSPFSTVIVAVSALAVVSIHQ